jgi:5,10-methylenetetrahydromethanopterin reductase
MTFSGTAAELQGRMSALASKGVTELVYSPAGSDIPGELRAMARVAQAVGAGD